MKFSLPVAVTALTLGAWLIGCEGTGDDDGQAAAGTSGLGASAGTAAGAMAGGRSGGGGAGGVAGSSAGAGSGGTRAGSAGNAQAGTGGAAGRGTGGGSGGASGGAGAGGSGTSGANSAGSGGSGGAGMSGSAGASGTAGSGGSGETRYDWILTAFTNESESNMYVYQSGDGRRFDLVKGPAYTPPGSQLVRDPSVILHPDGRYYLVYTTGWREKEFGIAYSTNLEDWTFLTTVPTLGNATSSWAPEWYVEEGTYRVIISISTTGNNDAFGNFTPHLFTAMSADLMNWDAGAQMIGIQPNYIDTFVVRSGATYHAFTKNENTKIIEHATATAIGGPYTFVGTQDWAGWGNTPVEGPCLYPLADGTWRMLVDGYTTSEYLFSDSEDLMEWSPRQALPDGLSGFIRHGTVLRRAIE